MEVRSLRKEDTEAAKELILSVLTKEYPFDKSAYSDSDLYDLKDTYSGSRESFFVLEDGGKIVGTTGIKEDSEKTALLRRVFVDPAHRRKGYGALLIDEALTFCKKKNYSNIAFRTTSRMTQAIELCKKKGFKQIEKIDLEGFCIYKFTRSI